MKHFRTALITTTTLIATFGASSALAGLPAPTLPGPGIFALLALGVVGAIGISRLRK